MGNWKETLAKASGKTTLKRALRCIGKGVRYKLGKGGIDPTKPMRDKCDCSGFVAWAIGIPRELPPGSGKWLQTTSYWQGGRPAGDGLFDGIDEARSEPGDIIVYPDRGSRQGHMGIVSAVRDGNVIKVIHCSTGNDRSTGDAIQETAPTVFERNPKTRIMRIDYAALRGLFGIPEPEDSEIEGVDVPFPSARLQHPILADDETLLLVARGVLELEPTGDLVAGCRALQNALNELARDQPALRVGLGSGNRWHGYYGPNTKKAVARFQKIHSIHPSGELDSETLFALDAALLAMDAGRSTAIGPIRMAIERDGRDWYASADSGSRFYVGKRVRYISRYGLSNMYRRHGPVYKPEEYEGRFGHWGWFLQPTAKCESKGLFNCLNTYDRARFTFGFFQMAAHTPNRNFVAMLRRLMTLANAEEYFPDLSIVDGRIVRNTELGAETLETDESTAKLLDYLNPTGSDVEEREVIQAAKFIHWSDRDKEHRDAQVEVAVEKTRRGMRSYASRYGLDGRVDTICLCIADIRHQGRAKSSEIIAALNAGSDEEAQDNLLEIGAHEYSERVATLKSEIRRLQGDGVLGRRRYDAASGEFVT